MAEKEPQEATTQVNAAGEAADTLPAAEQLPERIRVHALAKLLGVTSKRILAHLTDMGAQARSPQSSLDRTVAETVRDAFGPRAVDPAPATVDDAIVKGDELAADELAAEEVEVAAAAVVSTPRKRAPKLFTSPFQQPELPVEEPVQYQPSGLVAQPLFQSPDFAAAEETRRKLRAERKTKVEDKPKAEKVQAEDKPRAEEKPPVEEKVQAVEKTRGEQRTKVEAKVGEDKAVEDKAAEAEASGLAAATSDEGDDEQDWDGEQRGDGASRRRRRGRRGRGRGRGEQHPDDESGEIDPEIEDQIRADAEAEAEDSEDDDDDSAVPEGSSSRRRRRRRRRKGGEEAEPEAVSEDDPPNTVVHEREPRSKRRAAATKDVDEVQGISGSTRLEAKRQRRRDGREAGRRRPPILTESEFLARRESVDRVMVVREKHFQDHPTSTTQVAVLEDGVLVEHFVTSTGSASMVGNVYLGKVQNVLPSMEAAFVDIGRGRNGVLYAGEVNWEAAGLGGRERKIEQALRPGDTVLVQVSKDPVGHKGARLTTQISLAGRFLVYVPGGTSTGISRKLPDTERKRLKEILRDIVPQDAGVIIRTASEGVEENELARDVERLQQTWRTIEEQAKGGSGTPKTLYEEPDLLVKVVRDLFNEDFSKLVIEGDRAWTTVENYIRTVAPDLLVRVEKHENHGVDVFGSLRIDEQLAKALDRKVWLPSGGTLVIDRTEAMTVVDVNTGKFTGAGGSNLEETVTRNNLEAAEEIVRQMRLRDIGGMIVVDFIDMVLESNRDLVLRRLTEALGRDRTRHQVSEVTSLGLVQMTRKKLGTGLVEAFSSTCETCHGRGLIVHNYPVESAPVEEGAARREGSRRRRKDRGNAAPETPVVPEPAAPVVVEETAESKEKAAARRAHPVALAMASHHDDEDMDDATYAEQALANAATAGAEAVAEFAAARSAEPVKASTNGTSSHTSESEAAADAVVAEEAVVAAAEAAVNVAEAQAAAPVTRAPEPEATEPAQPARRAGRRRVARAVTAPASASEGAVFVLSSADQPQTPGLSLADLAPAEVAPRARPRRRAAGRPAGAPEGEN